MQKLKNKVTGEEYLITGAIDVPREIEENTFEVWMHFSVEVNVDGKIETIEVPPVDPEWEVVDVPDPEPEPAPEPEPLPVPVAPELTPEEIERSAWLEQWRVYERANRAMKALAEAGFEPTEEETARFNTLKNWVGTNRKPEYSQYI